MGRPMDYDEYASTYAHTRRAFPWIVTPLEKALRPLSPGTLVIEIGCGTANYIGALARARPDLRYAGFDRSEGMLDVARARFPTVDFRPGNAETRFPVDEEECRVAFCVDVVHHIVDLDHFFRETFRILVPGGCFPVFTDSEENIRSRSLTRFFPEILDMELDRYPSISRVRDAATTAGFGLAGMESAEGDIAITPEYLATVEAKCSSSMRLIPEEAHRRGVERLMEAARAGEAWRSCCTLIQFEKPA